PCDDGNPATSNDVYNEVCECAGTVGINEQQATPYQVYPNPTSGDWNIQWSTPTTDAVLEVRNAQGQLMWNSKGNSLLIPSSKWAQGIYFLTVTENGRVQYKTPLIKN
ncbi:MAG: T9SS type A sorting domain-containing protein, partial [Bacteroidetes bacterium]|nr:T9SS type A sorting domain-containing protein [Bacteroidota bacterium]